MSPSSMEKKSSSKTQHSILSYLPEEIITYILTRLPVKTLIRFRCVSKSWFNLISNSNFINTHLLNSSNSFDFTHLGLILRNRINLGYDLYYVKSSSLHSIIYPPHDRDSINYTCVLKLGYPSRSYHSPVSIVGSCDGLICVAIPEQSIIIIWNPSTRESKQSSILGKNLWHSSLSVFGFGYDKLKDDYKVVWMEFDDYKVTWLEFGKTNGPSNKNEVRIFSLRTNSWEKIKDFPHAKPNQVAGKFVNGVLHWFMKSSASKIVSLDLGNESYSEVAQPNYGHHNSVRRLVVLQGCLSVCCYLNDMSIDIWVMKEYGVRDSWIKLYTISHTTFAEDYFHFLFYPLCICMTGEILFKFLNNLVLYDPTTCTFKICNIKFGTHEGFEEAITNFESLVSPTRLRGRVDNAKSKAELKNKKKKRRRKIN